VGKLPNFFRIGDRPRHGLFLLTLIRVEFVDIPEYSEHPQGSWGEHFEFP
jgi:hypothetical protein